MKFNFIHPSSQARITRECSPSLSSIQILFGLALIVFIFSTSSAFAMTGQPTLELPKCSADKVFERRICQLSNSEAATEEISDGAKARIEGNNLTLSFKGQASSVRVNLEPGVEVPMVAKDLWQIRLHVPELAQAVAKVRFEIRNAIGETKKIPVDIRGADAPKADYSSNLIPGSQFKEFPIESKFLNAVRVVRVWLPPSYNPEHSYPVVYIGDGSAQFGNLLGREISTDQIAPFITVGIDNCGGAKSGKPWCRYEEYVPAPEKQRGNRQSFENHERFFLEDVIPFIEKEFSCEKSSAMRSISGFSSGADWAIAMAVRHPDLFSQVIAMSPPMSGHLAYQYPIGPKFFLSAGYFEPPIQESAVDVYKAIIKEGGKAEIWTFPYGHGNEVNFQTFKQAVALWLKK
ncbi:alpha/beta hydrolase [Undibacterium aquatile]|uniref:Esterase n=1 Tax=Undibacterium aquatile TaxID=1537398 RepID=A0ABR6XG94_9BURK|nr:alpha/beta hydrolase-fold protein [Undibacterium aquatile]MBC3811782.1 hypothetical protein [Undibacterium aquatile]